MATPHHPAGHGPATGTPYAASGGQGHPQPWGNPAAAAPGYGPPVPAGQAPPAVCRACGGRTAVDFKVRAHTGILIMMKFEHLDGPFCRDCGLAVVRQMTYRTLILGWWGPLSLVIVNPLTLVWNLVAYLKYRGLAPSEPAPGRTHLDTGPPVLRRPLAYLALIPLAWAVWVLTQILSHSA
ncbi:hypothetical protein AW27_002230 [Streptomyces sp. PCS3-D2]|uniref:hypothetical protein n=1 Tax=Streptomyces sp. PCS3-D2 TaxID=1460244 RepID=UPI00044A54AC|nr:hypothetical protein [Streptomyces sp. PCS3-D2]WKV70434.1 hypothetical protein AW27_002230 [Streptomyces sp. PCS3-D2]